MFRINPESAMQLIENERAIVRVLRSDPHDYADLLFELKQFADPENNRPLRSLDPRSDRNYVYDHTQGSFIYRELKRKERGQPQPGNQRIKAVSGTLAPQDGNMRYYNHANSNQGHHHVIYGVDAGADPDRYLYRHKKDPSIEVKDESCLIVSCFKSDAGTNTKWHIKGQPLNAYHAGVYPAAVTFAELREHNREFVDRRDRYNRHKDERNEVQFKPSKAAIHFVGSVSDVLVDRVNAIHFKLLIWEMLGIDLPILIFDDEGKHLYPEEEQAKDILKGFASGIPFAYDIHEKIEKAKTPVHDICKQYYAMYPSYMTYANKHRQFHGEDFFIKFFELFNANESKTDEVKHITDTAVTQTEAFKNSVKARKLWSDIVSKTYAYHVENPVSNDALLERLRGAGVTGDLNKILQDMCAYLQEHTKLVVAFQAHRILNGTPASLRYLNLSEMIAQNMQSDRQSHLNERNEVENATFSFLEGISEQFENLKQARPRYSYLTLCDQSNYPMPLTPNFGKSYFVLRDVVKFNSVFLPMNIISTYKVNDTPTKPCTYFDFEVLLAQTSDTIFLGLVHAVSGQLPDKKLLNSSRTFEMQAYVPPVELFDKNIVERIYISPNEYKLSEEEEAFFAEHGILVTTEGTHAYGHEEKQLKEAMKTDDVARVQRLFKEYPFLRYNLDEVIQEGDAVKYHFLVKHDPEAKPIPWQDMLLKVPADKLALFQPVWSEPELKALDGDGLLQLINFINGDAVSTHGNSVGELLLQWFKQFNAVNITLQHLDEESDNTMLLGTFLSGMLFQTLMASALDYSRILIELIDSALLPSDLVNNEAQMIFANPALKTMTRYLIKNHLCHLTDTQEEKEALLAGKNYVYLLQDPVMVAKIDWGNDKALSIAVDLLDHFDDSVFLEKSFSHMHAASAFSGLDFDVARDLIIRVARKNPQHLFTLMAFIFENKFTINQALPSVVYELKAIPHCETFVNFLESFSETKDNNLNQEKSENAVTQFLNQYESASLSVEKWQALFLNAYNHIPKLLRSEPCITVFCKNLPNFNFMRQAGEMRYAMPCIIFYYPSLVHAWVDYLPSHDLARQQEMVSFFMQRNVARNDVVRTMISHQPELIHTQVPITGDSLLHLALMIPSLSPAWLQFLIQSKVAHVDNAAGQSVLFLALKNMVDLTREKKSVYLIGTVLGAILLNVRFTNAQLILALDFMIKIGIDLQGYSQKICDLLNRNRADEPALHQSFMNAFYNTRVKRMESMWKSYLQIQSMSPAPFIEAIKFLLNANSMYMCSIEMHQLMDRTKGLHIVENLFSPTNNFYHASHMLSHSSFQTKCLTLIGNIVSEFEDLIQKNSRKIPEDLYDEVVRNFLIALDKIDKLTEFKQRRDITLHQLDQCKFTTLNLLVEYHIELQEEGWVKLFNFYVENEGANVRHGLAGILNKHPERIPAAWDVYITKIQTRSYHIEYIPHWLDDLKKRFCDGLKLSADMKNKIDADIIKARVTMVRAAREKEEQENRRRSSHGLLPMWRVITDTYAPTEEKEEGVKSTLDPTQENTATGANRLC